MTSYNSGSATTNYTYRADGMRTLKAGASSSTIYRYDGQMGIEDVDVTGSVTKVTDYAVGPRGIDSMSVTASGSTNVSYPLYDCHGNMVSTLAKAGSGSYSYSSVRLFDAWGNVRSANNSGDPKGRYCANLGHKQDDESGLVYMRARYYEPGSGRFVSEDPDLDGTNLFVYARCDPVNRCDSTGRLAESIVAALFAILIFGALWSGGKEYLAEVDKYGGIKSVERIAYKAMEGAIEAVLTLGVAALLGACLVGIGAVGLFTVGGLLSVVAAAMVIDCYIVLCCMLIVSMDEDCDAKYPA